MAKKSILFENLKKKIIKNAKSEVMRWDNESLILLNINLMKMGKSPIRFNLSNKSSEELMRAVREVVNRTDVRCARELYSVFKHIVPEWVATCHVECRDNNDGIQWILVES